ncbi:Nitric oxide synthase, brain [Terramyces sp. JEL0728]|nr:Nitric oxide synthase, brain [Terramyces sp. JEL0728]
MRNAPTLYRCFSVNGPKLQIQTPAANQLPVISSLNANPVDGNFTSTLMACTFTVDQKVIDRYTDSKLTYVMWSYSMDSGMHSQKNMLQINLLNGATDTPRHLLFKRLHGFGMIFTWLLLVPGAVFYARYFKTSEIRLHIKTYVLSASICMFLGFFAIIFLSGATFGTDHSVLGLIVFILTICQAALGFLSRVRLLDDSDTTKSQLKMGFGKLNLFLKKFKISIGNLEKLNFKWFKLTHQAIGLSLLIATVVQCGAGLNLLFPPTTIPRSVYPWVLYNLFVGFWILAFATAEIYFDMRVTQKDLGIKETAASTIEIDALKRDEEAERIAKFTWKDIEDKVSSGSMLLVVEQKYVVDVTEWTKSHPGGQSIFQTVNGTEVTNDFHHESKFDFNELYADGTIPDDIFKDDLENAVYVPLTVSDINNIYKCRRTHVHSIYAQSKMSGMVLGELASASEGELFFDKYEYQRYALTKKNVENGIASIRFCKLYPCDIRSAEPDILPGQYMEIQLRILGQRITRYYTPYKGTLDSFEIIVKLVPEGIFSQKFENDQEGESQFKIRGPFGTPFIEDDTTDILFIGGGSGITPCLQLIHYLYYFLGTTEAVRNYASPSFEMEEGDLIQVFERHLGSCVGRNISTGQTGKFPTQSIKPRKMIKLTLLNVNDSTRIAESLTQACSISYPDWFTEIPVKRSELNENISKFEGFKGKVIVCGHQVFEESISKILELYDLDCEFIRP